MRDLETSFSRSLSEGAVSILNGNKVVVEGLRTSKLQAFVKGGL